jgi:hypothetical protein
LPCEKISWPINGIAWLNHHLSAIPHGDITRRANVVHVDLPCIVGTAAVAAGWCFVAGTLVFSGSLYLLSLTGTKWLGAITPLGGVAFLAGWLCLLWAALKA